MTDINDLSLVRARAEVASCSLGDGAALLDMRKGMYYNVNAVATAIWDEIATPISVLRICQIVSAKFDVDDATCATDVRSLVADLDRLGLIEIENEPAN